MPVLLTPPYLQFLTTDGTNTPLAFGTVTTYAAGTSTKKATYTNASGATLAPNPIQLNGAGIPESGNGGIWITGSYDIVVKDQFGVTVDSQPNITSFNNTTTATSPLADTFSGNGSQTSFTLSQSLGTDPKTIMVFVAAPQAGFFQKFNGTGSQTAFTLSAPKGTDSTSLAVYVYNAALGDKLGFEIQDPSTYSISATALTFTVAPVTGTNNIYVSQPNAQNNNGIAGVLAPSAYTLNGTNLTFANAPVSGTNNIIVFAPTTLAGAAALSAAQADASATAAGNSAAAAAADVILTDADVVLTHADVVLTHADVVLTHADVISANNSSISAGNSATAANNSAIAAAASAALAAGSLLGTSTTSNAIGIGSKTFITQTGLDLGLGFVTIAETSIPSNYFHGQITSYNSGSGSLVINVLDIGGSGTHADWTISVSGPAGPAGTLGTTGSPIAGNLAKFSAPTTLTSGDLTGDITTSGGLATTLATVNPNIGSFTNMNATVNAKGQITAASNGSAGNLILLATQNVAAVSSVDFTSGINNTYAHYLVEISNLTNTSGGQVLIRLQQGGSFIATGYAWVEQSQNGGSTLTGGSNTADTSIPSAGIPDTTEPQSIIVNFFRPDLALFQSISSHAFGWSSSGAAYQGLVSGTLKTSAATTGIRFLPNAGTISGTFKLYGVL